MPIRTPIYQLEAFSFGDIYSASADRRRFLTIDNQLAFLADQITDGRIDGWGVSVFSEVDFELAVSPGMGLIKRFATRTFGTKIVEISDNNTFYLYMRRKQGIIGGFSGFSPLSLVTVVDITAPATPLGFTVDDVSFNSVSLLWDGSSEVDLSHYVIARSTNGSVYDTEYRIESGTEVYEDINVEENTLYYYKIKAVDYTGNLSSFSSVVTISTTKDLSIPVGPTSAKIFSGDGLIQLFWETSPSDNIDKYEVHVKKLNLSYEFVETFGVFEAQPEKNFLVIRGLENNIPYNLELYAVTSNNIYSEEVIVRSIPTFNNGPEEISDIDISFSKGLSSEENVIVSLDWTPFIDPYVELPASYILTFISNGIRSNPIKVLDGVTSRVVQVLPFTSSSGSTSFSSIKENTSFLLIVQSVDLNANVSNGIITSFKTPSFKVPSPITNLSVLKTDGNAFFITWTNSKSKFLGYNILTITKTNLNTTVVEDLVSELNIGITSNYTLSSSEFSTNSKFDFTIRPVNIYENEGSSTSSSYTTLSIDNVERPDVPDGQGSSSGNGIIQISWDKSNVSLISYHKIWRANFTSFLTADDFNVIDTVPSSVTKYTDFGVIKGNQYAYFVTSIDIFGQESFNPEDNYISYTLLISSPSTGGTFSSPSTLSVVQSGFDSVLTWTNNGTEQFDGYEIHRSIGNKYSFEPVASADASALSYTDEDVLLTGGSKYYYIIRKYRDEVDVIVSESQTYPNLSIILAKITVDNGIISIDETPANEIKNIEDPVREETIRQISFHKHTLDNDGTDRRIDLGSNILVSDWVTEDFFQYTTESDMSGAAESVVRINGEPIDILYTIDFEKGTLVFEKILFSTDEIKQFQIASYLRSIASDLDSLGLSSSDRVRLEKLVDFQNNANSGTEDEQTDRLNKAYEATLILTGRRGRVLPRDVILEYTEPPFIEVELLGVSEVSNILPLDKMGDISANQVDSGYINIGQIPTVNHNGRINHKIIPDQISTDTEDFLNFSLSVVSEVIGKSVSFYDVFQVGTSDRILASTSNGIMSSDDFGLTWVILFDTKYAPGKIIYSNSLGKYLVATNKGVFLSSGDLVSWTKIPGLENVKVVRDMIIDADNFIYCSTDLGVFKIDINRVDKFLSWDQTPIFGVRSTEAYGMLYDSNDDRIVVGNEFGLLESSNNGLSWSFSSEFDLTKKLYNFAISNEKIFAISNDTVWRKDGVDFIEIASLDSDYARNLTIYDDRIYISTDLGLLISDKTSDIYSDTDIDFKNSMPEINITINQAVVTGISIIEDMLFILSDKRIFTKNNNKINLLYDAINGVIPSVYIDNQKIDISYRYSISNNTISFDEKIDVLSKVTVANQYKKYTIESGGWAGHKFDSKIVIRVNGKEIYNIDKVAIENESNFSNLIYPEITERNSYYAGALLSLDIAKSKSNRVFDIVNNQKVRDEGGELDADAVKLNDGEILSDVVRDSILSISNFLSYLFEDARVIETSEGEEPFSYPEISVSDTGVVINVSDGSFTFSKEYSKFDVLNIDIIGSTVKNIGDNTHRDLEDKLELANSGLPSALSQVFHSNIVKGGVLNEKIWPSQQEYVIAPYQAKYIVPRNSDFYGKLDSTVDYTLEEESVNDISLSLFSVTSVLFISETGKILVGGIGGLLSIDISNLDIDEIEFTSSEKNIFVKDIIRINNNIYVLTKSNIYYSSDYGSIWTKIGRSGLPNDLFSIKGISNSLIIGASDGIYYKAEQQELWLKVVSSTDPVEVMINPDFIFAIVDGSIYKSSNGLNFSESGKAFDITINALSKFKSLIFAATSSGLRKDDSTFYSNNDPILSLIDVLGDRSASSDIVFNCIASDTISIVAGVSDGSYYILNGTGGFDLMEDSNLESIHKIILINNEPWLFGYDRLKTPLIEQPIRLSTGAPV